MVHFYSFHFLPNIYLISGNNVTFYSAICVPVLIAIDICLLYLLQTETDKNKIEEQLKTIKLSQTRLSEIDWNIRNYAQFSKEYGKQVISTQQLLMNDIRQFISDKKGDLENFRKQQFEYNDAVRKAHGEILKMKKATHST